MKTDLIEEMQALAAKRGGTCLSPKYIDTVTKLTWQCAYGHQWDTAPHSIKQGSWCPACAGVKKSTIEEMQQIAAERGGKCLSQNYINSFADLTWQCKEGHQWQANPNNIKKGTWCPACACQTKGTIDEMQEIAAERGGKCLSDTYTNNRTKLTWQCRQGHQWQARPFHIKQGSWCPACQRKTRRRNVPPQKEMTS